MNREVEAGDKRGHDGRTDDSISVKHGPIEALDEDFSISAS
jgi:hypothetical protein